MEFGLENIWKILAGLAIFIFGIFQQEEALGHLAGRAFKLFLKKFTSSRLKSALSGTIVTIVLQSSTVVILLAIGFFGAGVINLPNALAVTLGSNLGTTFANWIVTLLGFKYSIESFALPVIALSGIGQLAFLKQSKWYFFSRFLMGFGLLFLGLGMIKGGISEMLNGIDLSRYEEFGALFFIGMGFMITAIIQTSSATMVLAMSAIGAGAISFEMGIALVIGSELGTSVKMLFNTMGGASAAKKRVAYGNIFFNAVVALIAYLLMKPLFSIVFMLIGRDPFYGIVLFQTLINLFGLVIFLPILGPISRILERIFKKKRATATFFISIHPNSEAAAEVLENETQLFIYRVIKLNCEAFQIDPPQVPDHTMSELLKESNPTGSPDYKERYEYVKHAEGEIISFFNQVSAQSLEKTEHLRLWQLVNAVRNAMYAAKGIRDVRKDRKNLMEAAEDTKYEHYQLVKGQLEDFYEKINAIINGPADQDQGKALSDLWNEIKIAHDQGIKRIHADSSQGNMDELDISSLLNLNREVYSSCKAMILALKGYLAIEDEEKPDELPTLETS